MSYLIKSSHASFFSWPKSVYNDLPNSTIEPISIQKYFLIGISIWTYECRESLTQYCPQREIPKDLQVLHDVHFPSSHDVHFLFHPLPCSTLPSCCLHSFQPLLLVLTNLVFWSLPSYALLYIYFSFIMFSKAVN